MVHSTAKFLGLATLAVLFTARFADAGPGENGKGAAAPGNEAKRAEFLKRFDKNGDGKLDDQERAAAKQAMQERGGPLGKGQPGQGGGDRPNMEEVLKRFDKNGNGKLDKDERAAAKKAMEERRAKKNEK